MDPLGKRELLFAGEERTVAKGPEIDRLQFQRPSRILFRYSYAILPFFLLHDSILLNSQTLAAFKIGHHITCIGIVFIHRNAASH
jgi:hypothetical protein